MSATFPTISVSSLRPNQANVTAILLPLYDERQTVAFLPTTVQRIVQKRLRQLNWSAVWGTTQLLPAPKGIKAEFIGFIGLGSPQQSTTRQTEGFRRGIGKAIQQLHPYGVKNIAVALPDNDPAAFARAATEAIHLITYRFNDYKSDAEEQTRRDIRRAYFLTAKKHHTATRQAIHDATIILSGIYLTRELVNQPAAHSSPTALVEVARRLAKENPTITLKTFNRAQAAKAGFNAFLAVARGSKQEPYIIHLTYTPKTPSQPTVALVGKGITFDSGGLSLKPAAQMEDMKIDMAGAATVLGVISVLAQLNLPVTVHCIIATCENMPSGDAYRPGDILQAFNQKTIEVLNTDAEGRIVLADALSYATTLKPDTTIDVATLTGAVVVALGETHAGLFSNNNVLRQALLIAAKQTGEGLTALPLPEEYQQLIRSSVADIRNTTPNHPMGGSITAALFLKEFIGHTPWAHLDISGPVYINRKPLLSYYHNGATGYGVRTLIQYLRNIAQSPT